MSEKNHPNLHAVKFTLKLRDALNDSVRGYFHDLRPMEINALIVSDEGIRALMIAFAAAVSTRLDEIVEDQRKGKKLVGYKSIAVWPKTVSTGTANHESDDRHDTREGAEHICHRLRMEGLGGERKVFPISTRVEEIWE